jgi:hypothetical protein
MDTLEAPTRGRLAARAPEGRRPAYRGTAVLVGVLFLTSTAAFAVGSSLVASSLSGDGPASATLLAGVLLEVYTGLAVAGIGLAMLPLLRRHDVRLARAYLGLRVLECLAIVAVGASLLATGRALHHDHLVIYSFTAVGGIVLSYLLLVSGLVPRGLSMLGLIGYAVLLAGVPAALAGIAELDAGWGVLFLVPGGLFELALPLLLLVKGFSVDPAAGPPLDDPSPGDGALRRAAIVAGLGLLAMALLAFGGFSAFERLVVEGDARATAGNVADHAVAFRAIACAFVVVAGLDVLVAWALYVLLRPVHQAIALLSAWLRIAYAAVFAVALGNLFVAVRRATDADSLDAQVLTSVEAFQDGWDLALVIFGLHLLVLGYLVVRSRYIPGVLGVLVAVAALGYLVDSLGGLLSRSYDADVALVTFPGEVLLMGWLLWRGRRLQAPPR